MTKKHLKKKQWEKVQGGKLTIKKRHLKKGLKIAGKVAKKSGKIAGEAARTLAPVAIEVGTHAGKAYIDSKMRKE